MQHAIEGKDLLVLTDADLRTDLKFKRLHDRKYILRKIAELKVALVAVVEVTYLDQVCRVRVGDPTSYTFELLRCDATHFWGFDEDVFVLKDSHGLLWGAVPINCIFDSDLNQLEPVLLVHAEGAASSRHVSALPETQEADEEDFNEDNPHHICASVDQSSILNKSRPLSPDTSAKFITSFLSQSYARSHQESP
jgi:hypothetical protein